MTDDTTLFFSDVHLSVAQPVRTKLFLRFLASPEFRKCPHIYILGDLFDLWIGPSHISLVDYKEVLGALRQATREGQMIYFIYGNRDFLVGKEFSRATGVKVVGDSLAITLGGQKVWLTHGDLLCTADRGYRSYRRLARSRLIRAAYKSLPGGTRYRIGQGLRDLSRDLVSKKPVPERSLVAQSVASVFRKGYEVIICGHIHQATQSHPGGMAGQTLFTLGDWVNQGHYLIYAKGSFRPEIFL